MAKLQFSVLMSLDGYTEDKDGNFDWAAPDPEVHTFINDLERPIGTYLLRATDVRSHALLGSQLRA